MVISPKISIITVCFNSVNTIEETIQSVINQQYKNVEYIIIDGGSKDGTLEIIKCYERQISYWETLPDKNMYDAINKGLAKVTGHLWMSLNSDDFLVNSTILDDVVAEYVKYGDQYIAYFGDIIRLKKGIRSRINLFSIDHSILLASGHCSFMPQPSTFLLKEVIETIGYFDLQYNYASDYDYFLRVTHKYKVRHIPKAFTVFRDHETSITNRLHVEMNKERLHILHFYSIQSRNIFRTFYKYFFWGWYSLLNPERLSWTKIKHLIFKK